jgi:glycosylphosphatidylinositol transamidase
VDAVLASSRISRQQLLGSRIHTILVPFLSTALPVIAVLWLLALPLDRWGRTTYFDENAIQPGQVKTFWDWDDVHLADQWLAGIENVWKGGQGTSRE